MFARELKGLISRGLTTRTANKGCNITLVTAEYVS